MRSGCRSTTFQTIDGAYTYPMMAYIWYIYVYHIHIYKAACALHSIQQVARTYKAVCLPHSILIWSALRIHYAPARGTRVGDWNVLITPQTHLSFLHLTKLSRTFTLMMQDMMHSSHAWSPWPHDAESHDLMMQDLVISCCSISWSHDAGYCTQHMHNQEKCITRFAAEAWSTLPPKSPVERLGLPVPSLMHILCAVQLAGCDVNTPQVGAMNETHVKGLSDPSSSISFDPPTYSHNFWKRRHTAFMPMC